MANYVYVTPGTTVLFKASGGDIVMNLDNIATAVGHVSALWDRGAGAQPADYEVQLTCQVNATVTLGLTATMFYASSHDNSIFDGTIPAGDAALSAADLRRNLRTLVVLAADQTAATVNMTATSRVTITTRYILLVFYNEFGVTTKTTANSSFCAITPVPLQIQ